MIRYTSCLGRKGLNLQRSHPCSKIICLHAEKSLMCDTEQKDHWLKVIRVLESKHMYRVLESKHRDIENAIMCKLSITFI